MLQQIQKAPAVEAELLGDLTPLLEQLGSPDGLAALAGAWDPLAATTVGTSRRAEVVFGRISRAHFAAIGIARHPTRFCPRGTE